MAKKITIYRIFSEEPVEGRVDVILDELGTSARVGDHWMPVDQAVAQAKGFARRRSASIGVYLRRREQWKEAWGELL